MTRKDLVCALRDYAKMTEEPPTGRAIEGQEEIMRRAADMLENSVEIDRVLKIIDSNYPDSKAIYSFSEYEAADAEGQEKALDRVRDSVMELKEGEQE